MAALRGYVGRLLLLVAEFVSGGGNAVFTLNAESGCFFCFINFTVVVFLLGVLIYGSGLVEGSFSGGPGVEPRAVCWGGSALQLLFPAFSFFFFLTFLRQSY